MATLDLIPVGGELISLDALERDWPSGIQALKGVTGFGLPEVDTYRSEGAGDGARWRGSRVRARTVDLPLYLDGGESHSAEAAVLSELVMALSNECILRYTDDAAISWEIRVHRTGGGDYAMGEDTYGRKLKTIITLEAGDPYWKRTTPESKTIAKPFGVVPFVVAGDAPAKPVWTVTGPGIDLVLPSLTWGGVLGIGETLTIDTDAGTITDNLGRNRYADLGTAPRFDALAPGVSNVEIGFDSTSADFGLAFGLNAYNYVTNPRLPNLAGWTGKNIVLWPRQTQVVETEIRNVNQMRQHITGGGIGHERSMAITGLTVGEQYRFGVRAEWRRTGSTWGKHTQPHFGPYIEIRQGVSVGKAQMARSDLSRTTDQILTGTFVATATTAVLVLGAGTHKNWDSGTYSYFWEPYLTEGDVYFTGATPATTGLTYAWEGTVDASRSVQTRPNPPSNATTKIDVAWFPRKQAMI